MSKPAAMEAQIVNARNVGVHKSVALTLHIPEERAAAFFEMFGWPTMSNPIPVAIARLNAAAQTTAADREGSASHAVITAPPAIPPGVGQEARAEDASGSAAPLCPDAGTPSPAGLATGFGERPRRPFTSLALPAQAAMLCQDAVFRVYVVETWKDVVDGCRNEDEAQAAMYARYNITSRRELQHNTRAGQRFMHDRDQFMAWKVLAA